MLTSTQGSNWYLLQCKPRQDERAQINLLRQNYVIFCPQIISERLIHGKPHQSLESLSSQGIFSFS